METIEPLEKWLIIIVKISFVLEGLLEKLSVLAEI